MHAVGLTWAKPQLLTSLGAASEWCSNMPATGHGVQLPSGKLLVPGYHLRKCTKIDAEVVEEAHAWLSDGGVGDARRWKISAGFHVRLNNCDGILVNVRKVCVGGTDHPETGRDGGVRSSAMMTVRPGFEPQTS